MNDEQKMIMQHIRSIGNATMRHIDRYFDSKKQLDNLSCSGSWILARVFESEHSGTPLFQRDFENEFGITRSTASKMLTGLEQKGLITRAGVTHDGRLKQILLTERSKAISQSIHTETSALEEKLERGFSTEELDMLFGFFERIEHNLAAAGEEAAQKENGAQDQRTLVCAALDRSGNSE